MNTTRITLEDNSEIIVLVKDSNRKITLRLDEDALTIVANTTDSFERAGEVYRVAFTEASGKLGLNVMSVKERRKEVKFKMDVGTFIFRLLTAAGVVASLVFSLLK